MLLSRASIRAGTSPWSALLISHRVGQHRCFATEPEVKVSHVPARSSGKGKFLVVGALGLGATAVAYTQKESIKELIFKAKPSIPAALAPKAAKPTEEKRTKAKGAVSVEPAAASLKKDPKAERERLVEASRERLVEAEKARILTALGEAEGASQGVLREVIAAAGAVGVEGPLLDGAMAQLSQLEEAEKVAAARAKASSTLQDAVAGESMEALRAAIHQAAELIGNDEEILQAAASKLSLLERREACSQELGAAVGAADPQRCAAALEEGSNLGLTSSAEYQLAEVVTESRRRCDALVRDDSVLFAKYCKTAFSVEDFAAAVSNEAIEAVADYRAAAAAGPDKAEAKYEAFKSALAPEIQKDGTLLKLLAAEFGSGAEGEVNWPKDAAGMTSGKDESLDDFLARLQGRLSEVSFAKEAIENLNVEQLRERLLERSRALAESRLYHSMRMEDALSTFRESVDAGYRLKLDKALCTLEESLGKKAKSEREALEVSLQEQNRQIVQQAIAKAKLDAAEVTEMRLAQLREQAMTELGDERYSHLHALRGLHGMIEATETALSVEDNLKLRAQSNTKLSAALLGLEVALQGGHCPAKEFDHLKAVAAEADPFAVALLEQLPKPCLELVRKRIPTEPGLQRSFQDRLGNLISLAFVPQNSGLLGHLMGRVLCSFYILERDPNATPHVEPNRDKPTDIEQNLAALSRAAYQVEQGELVKAIAIIEGSLVGNCRQGAIDWVTEARLAMTLRQVMTALKAQAQCLNYSLI